MISFICAVFISSTAWAADPFLDSVSRMVENSPKYRSTLEAIEADKAAATPGLYSHYPELAASATHITTGVFKGEQDNVKNAALNATLSVPIYRFGADAAKRNIATLTATQANLFRQSALVATEKEMALLLLEAVKANKFGQIEERIFKARVDLLNKADALFKRGLLPAEELDKMRYDVGLVKLQVALSKSQLAEQQHKVILFGGAVSNEWPWTSAYFARFESWDAEAALQKYSAKFLESARVEVQKSSEQLEAARANYLPSLNLNASAEKNFALVAGAAAIPAAWSVGLTASVPVFSRMEDSSKIDAAARSLSAANLKVQDQQRTTEAEIRAAVATAKELVVASHEREQFLLRANQNLTRARERFLGGRISANDLAADETRVYQMEQSLLDNSADLHSTVVGICAAFVLPLQQCLAELR